MPLRDIRLPILRPPREDCVPPTCPDPYAKGSKESTAIASLLEYFDDAALEFRTREKDEEMKGLDDWEKMYLSYEMIVRFLKASRWSVTSAIQRLQACLVWRRTIGIYDVEAMSKEVEPESESGKMFNIGFTRKCQPILCTFTSKNVMPASERQVKHMMFFMERLLDLQVAGVQDIMFLADVSGKTQSSSGAMGVARSILSCFQNYYPERLGEAAVVRMPWLGSLFITLIWPFIDSDTRKKIHVNPTLTDSLVAPGQLLDIYGGELAFDWDMQTYLPALVEMCVQRREENLARWRALGGRVGLSEWDFLEPFGGGVGEEKAGSVVGENGVGARRMDAHLYAEGIDEKELPGGRVSPAQPESVAAAA